MVPDGDPDVRRVSDEPATGLRVATLTAGFCRNASGSRFEDWLEVADPDAVIPLGAGSRARQRLSETEHRPVLDPRPGRSLSTVTLGSGDTGPSDRSGPAELQIRLAPSVEALRDGLEGSGTTGGELPPVIVTSALELHVDTTALSTHLSGRAALEAARAFADGPTPVVLSTAIPAGFRNAVEGVQIIGVGEHDDPADTGLATVEVRADGTVLTGSIDSDRLGLRALTGVGGTRAQTLRDAGFETRAAVAEAPLAEIQELPGFGSEVATTVTESAAAIATRTVRLRRHRPLPVSDPLFIDIETDGLHPTTTWLVGVLDGGPRDGTYRSFCTRDPEDPGRALDAFLDWYGAEGDGRPLVAYNGRTFDFPVVRDHLQAYRPALVEAFDEIETFDPYAWAVTDEHAVLPGRTNRLEDVATALGFEGSGDGLTGAAVARAYRQWMHAPSTETEPDWNRFDRYCEADTRALATVYQALEAATPDSAHSKGDRPRPTTTQGTLGDW